MRSSTRLLSGLFFLTNLVLLVLFIYKSLPNYGRYGYDTDFVYPASTPSESDPAPKATFVFLLKDDGGNARRTILNLDEQFNKEYAYPITVFHENLPIEHQQFMREASTGAITFVPLSFSFPSWVNASEVPASIGFGKEYMGYRHMCRFYSGQIFTHKALAHYDYMWRVDDDARFLCPIEIDPFSCAPTNLIDRYMRRKGLKYGWSLWFWEDVEIAADTLWDETRAHLQKKGVDFTGTRLQELSTWFGRYDRCHYWNNFEVLDLNFFRGSQYQSYFNYLDRKAGFYFYRWGDALVRTLGIHAFLREDEVERLNWISYRHTAHCLKLECAKEDDCLHCPVGVCDHCRYKWERKTRGIWVRVAVLASLLSTVFLLLFYRQQLPKLRRNFLSLLQFDSALRGGGERKRFV